MLNENVKKFRREQRYTAPQLAKLVGVTSQTIYDIETGRNDNPGIKIVTNLAKAFKVSVNTLVK